MLVSHITNLLSSQINSVSIFTEVVQLLASKRIELPTYNHLHVLITNQLKKFQIKLETILAENITETQANHLNNLLNPYSGNETQKSTYLLANFKNISIDTNYSEVQSNLRKMKQLMDIQKSVASLLCKLPLNSDGVRYIGDLVCSYRTSQLQNKSKYDKYLHLICFVEYQTKILTDQLIRTYLDKVKLSLDFVKNKHDQNRLRAHQSSKPKVTRVIKSYENIRRINDSATTILWRADNILSAEEKVELLQALFPKQKLPDPVKDDIKEINTLFNM